ncbi:MAG: FAD-dependent oxidoreductase, partial [Bacteroidota bacterium]
MTERQYDVTIIGGGPGGYVAAIRAAQNGLKVGLVERDKLGGVCLNWGCIPTKALLRSAELYMTFKRSEEFGITYTGLSFDFSKIIARSRGISERISKGVEYLMKKNKIDVIKGTAKLTGKNSLEVSKNGSDAETIKTRNII